MTKPVVIITGASSGMGESAAKQFFDAGYTVYAGARRIEKMAHLSKLGIHTFRLDVTDSQSNQAFVDQVLKDAGRIDILINNAGYGSFGALEDVSPEEAKQQFDVNVFGAMNLTQLVLPTMRAQHSGRIINNSSIVGQIYAPLGGWYFASKHAFEALSDSLRLEVKQFGIDVVITEPGGTNTNWLKISADHLIAATPANSAYRKMVDAFTSATPTGLETADQIGALMLKVAQIKHPKTRYQATMHDKWMVIAARKFSYRMFDRMVSGGL
ncbi:MAG: oxidoreductase [Furfurilactobacillus sp.]|jgi:NADP-dependent 3-hydroxy acid dehydrogenase YdfG|uniref:Oxidoreductase n=1 Tax=Furfurilactobacillus milii TaxID=2888272 RepID=A0ABT6DDX0_9LACO|nr:MULTISPECIES: oxidoreductase [Furfurilactobacillus]QLE67286.1 short-chain dehydrogenase-oxidoreductase [Furfurilactobacillus rossiae]MCF6161024.1 SDR family NAD(P)-dependent oxidoreductase [Furfurilactobacillus milii]MCF6163486.1 SDR family NAD(P)-dependent oxidoreductase [Furfurilactobacillus milii]MCF6418713.1 SDR family NAD(P)-dependent oxidoreductase [Furfurilactobacillus milii]MCH4011476.1 oxidoreductase [Furfurilactobacillus sp.]